MRRYVFAVLVLSASSILFHSCDRSQVGAHKHDTNLFEVTDYCFSDNFKTMSINTVLTRNVTAENTDDVNKIGFRVSESTDRNLFLAYPMEPRMKDVVNTAAEQAADAGIQLSVLVDLTLRQDAVDRQRRAVLQMRSVFHNGNMVLSFMDSDGISEAYEASDYILDNYFVSLRPSSGSGKLLYEAILKHTASYADTLTRRVFVILTDGHTYSDGRPIDPCHFQNQEKLQRRCASFPPTSDLCCVSFADERDEDDASDFLRNLCERTGGIFQDSFDWNALKNEIFNNYGIRYVDWTFVVEYPDGKVFNGKKTLDIDVMFGDSLITGALLTYRLGSYLKPEVVNGRSRHQVIMSGTILVLLLALLIYVAEQIVIPRILDMQFRRKFVRRYEKENTSVNGMLVDKECYYCKAPFVPGDEIVAKCRHVMHRSCWNENGGHCPEYGRHCNEGYHYYNRNNLLDPQNCSFHLKWIMVALASAYVAWIGVGLMDHEGLIGVIFDSTHLILGDDQLASNHEMIQDMILGNMNQFPSLGFWLGSVLILGLALMGVHRNRPLLLILDVATRVLVGTSICLVVFYLCNLASILFDMGQYSFLIDWIPWVASGLAILFAVTYNSRIRVNRYWGAGALLVGIVSMVVWNLFFANYGKDYRVLVLFGLILFSIGLSMSIARGNPRSERYFFHLAGAAKETEIALFKWFSANSNRIVTIGKSVDCDIVMSWDIAGDIAPVHVSVMQRAFGIYVEAIEDGVLVNGRPARAGRKMRIYHGNTITVGRTTFTLIEKDI